VITTLSVFHASDKLPGLRGCGAEAHFSVHTVEVVPEKGIEPSRPYFQPSESGCGRSTARRIHGYLGGIEAGRSETKEAGGYCSATVGRGACSDEDSRP